MEKKCDTNEEPTENLRNTSFNSKDYNFLTISEEPNPSGSQPYGIRTSSSRKKESNAKIQFKIISDDTDAKLEHIPDMSKPSYDPRRYFSYKFRHSPTRNKQRAPVSEAKIRAARYCALDPTKTYTCMKESAKLDLSFSSRYPTYLGDDFKFIKYPPLEKVSPPEFQPNRPRNTIDIEKYFDDFAPQGEQAERGHLFTPSSEEIKVIHLRDLDNDTESQSSLKDKLSEVLFSQFSSGSLYQESSELLSTTNETSKEKKAEPMVEHEFDDLNKIKSNATLETIYRTSDPLSSSEEFMKNEDMSQKEYKEHLKVPNKQDCDSNTNLPKQKHPEAFKHPDFIKRTKSPPPSEQKATENRCKKPPLIYEDFKEQLTGPKPQFWIDFKETGEIGKTVAIFDSRDFRFYNGNIKPMWIDKDFDFLTPIPKEIHEFSETFMSHIPFYDNENEEIRKFAQEYKLLRAGPKYNIQLTPEKKKTTKTEKTKEIVSDTNSQKETIQNDPKNDSSASETKISESQGPANTDQDTTTVTEEKPAIKEETPVPKKFEVETYASKLKSAAPFKHPMSMPQWGNSVSTGDLSHRTQSHTGLKKITSTKDEKSEGNYNNSNKKTQSLTNLSTPKYNLTFKEINTLIKKTTFKENEKSENTGKSVSKKTQCDVEIATPILKATHKNKDVCNSKQQAEKSDYKTKNAAELEQQPKNSSKKSRKAKKSQFKTEQQANSTPEIINNKASVTNKAKSHNGIADQNIKKTMTSSTTSREEWVREQGKAPKSDKAKRKQNPKSPQDMQQKYQKSKFGF